MHRKLLYSFAAVATAAAVYLFFLPQHEEVAEEEEEHEAFVAMTEGQMLEHGIVMEVARAGDVQTILSVPARIQLNQDKVMHLVPKVSGIVREANKRVGDPVTLGEILAVFESGDMAIAKSKYLDSLKKESVAAANLSREKQLHDKQISAAQDYQNAMAEAESARIELELARQHLHMMGLSFKEIDALPKADAALLNRYELRSPMRGVIIERSVTKGELIDTAHEIYVVADPTSLSAEIYLFPSDFSLLEKSVELELLRADGKRVSAQVISMSPSVDSATGALRLVALLDNSKGDWRQGGYAKAELKGKKESVALAVPKEAIQQIEGDTILFVRKEEGFEVRPVKIGICDQQCVEILSGLSPGESYASKNTFLLKADHGKDEAEHMD